MIVVDVELDAARKLAEFEASSAVETRSKLIDEHHSAFRWIIASLFALNGGAILSIFGRERFGLETVFPVFWIFFGGIISTFLTVVVSQMSDRLMIARMHQWGLYWTSVQVTAARDTQHEDQIKRGIATAEKWGRGSRYLAIFAMVWFALGALSTVVLRQKTEVAKIESEMIIRESKLERIEEKLDQLERSAPKQ